MQNFVEGRRPVSFKAWRGQVVGASKRSDTHVSSSGGVNGQPVNVRSQVTVQQEFFLRPANGGPDTAVQLVDADVPVVDGQDVTVIAGFKPNTDNGPWVRLVNHSARRFWPLENGVALVGKWGLLPNWSLIGLGVWIVGLILPIPATGTLGFIAMLGLIGYHWYARKTMGRKIDQHLDAIGESLKMLA